MVVMMEVVVGDLARHLAVARRTRCTSGGGYGQMGDSARGQGWLEAELGLGVASCHVGLGMKCRSV